MAVKQIDADGIKQQTNIIDLISESTRLSKTGNIFRGLCPLHPDKQTESLMVYPSTNSWFCFGCNQGGSVIDWVMLRDNVSFKVALEKLGSGLGLPTRLPVGPPLRRIGRSLPSPLPLKFAQYWHANLNDRRGYFHQRGFTDETIDRELWGWTGRRYALTVWEDEPQVSPLIQVRLRKCDVIDPDGQKYIGLTGYNDAHLYNTWRLKGSKEAWIFFGEFDAALASQLGLPAVSPTNGMQAWDENWTEKYLRYMDKIYVVPDKGEEKRGWQLAKQIHAQAKVIQFPGFKGKDFTDWILAGHTIEELTEGTKI